MADFDVNSGTLEPGEKEALSALLAKAMGAAAASLTELLGRDVKVGSPAVLQTMTDKVVKDFPAKVVTAKVKFAEGVLGMNWVLLREKDGTVIADLMMGNDGSAPPEELTDIHLSAVSEVLSQLINTSANQLSKLTATRIGVLTPDAQLTQLKDPAAMADNLGGSAMVRATYPFSIEGLVTSELNHLMPLKFAKQLVAAERSAASRRGGAPVSAAQPTAATGPSAASAAAGPAVVQPAQFAPLVSGPTTAGAGNVDLLMDVPLQITVELGRATKLVKDILALGPGSIVQLDKLAGEPVDVLVNDKLVARGEVVVIDESFGVRVTDIVSRRERISSLQ